MTSAFLGMGERKIQGFPQNILLKTDALMAKTAREDRRNSRTGSEALQSSVSFAN